MSMKHVTDRQVVEAYRACKAVSDAFLHNIFPYDILMEATGQCFKVCYGAMDRAADRNLVEYGVSLRTGWVTKEGDEFMLTGKEFAK
jgi:hypothetical protein